MKLNKLIAGVAGTCATLFVASSYGFAYDSAKANIGGKAQRSYHALSFFAGDCEASKPLCDINFLGNSETNIAFRVSDPAFMDDHSHIAGTTTNYTNTLAGSVASVEIVDTYFPECTAAAQAVNACAPQEDSSANVVLGFWDLDVDTNRKIIEGWATSETTITGIGLVTAYLEWKDGEIERVCIHSLPAVAFAANYQSIADDTDGTTTCESVFLASAVINTEAATYVTCNPAECGGGSAKSVPVPALAAATLGLGLVGVTVLTGRRKQQK